MEEKKSKAADLERGRGKRLMVAAAAVAALFVAVLQLPIPGSGGDDDELLLDDLAQDMELLPALMQHDMLAAVELPEEKPRVIERVKAVDEMPAREPDRLLEDQLPLAESEPMGEGEAADEAPAVAPVAVGDDDEPLSFRVVEQLPEFPGGMVAFMKWLTKNLRYPPQAQNGRLKGKVVVRFIINKDGTTSDARVMMSVSPLFDREVLRVLRMMPRWKPGEDHGRPCRTMFVIPIYFGN